MLGCNHPKISCAGQQRQRDSSNTDRIRNVQQLTTDLTPSKWNDAGGGVRTESPPPIRPFPFHLLHEPMAADARVDRLAKCDILIHLWAYVHKYVLTCFTYIYGSSMSSSRRGYALLSSQMALLVITAFA